MLLHFRVVVERDPASVAYEGPVLAGVGEVKTSAGFPDGE